MAASRVIFRLPTRCHGTTRFHFNFPHFVFDVNAPVHITTPRIHAMEQPNTPDVSAPTPGQDQSISAAAHAYQLAMQQQAATPPSTAQPVDMPLKDVIMADGTPDRPAVYLPSLYHHHPHAIGS